MKKVVIFLSLLSLASGQVFENICAKCHGVKNSAGELIAPSKEMLLKKYKTASEFMEAITKKVKEGVMPEGLPFGIAARELYGSLPSINSMLKKHSQVSNNYKIFFKILPSTPPIPKYNPMTRAKILLGKMLYYDPRLSRSKVISCNTCHNLALGGDDNRPVSIGDHWRHGTRNAPTVFNAAFLKVQFWDGRAKDLEEQAKGPLTAHAEMNSSPKLIVRRLKRIPGYVKLFKKAFPHYKNPITFENVVKAIAAFERTLITPYSPFDRYLAGDENALTPIQKKGLKLFVKIGCVSCHRGPVLSDGRFHKFKINKDKGRYLVTKNPEDMYKFRTAQLRNVALTAPYFHDGSVWSLRQAVKIMAKKMLNKDLSNKDAYAISKFLESLTGYVPEEVRTMPILPK
jgi:cytochrome c peroxidase